MKISDITILTHLFKQPTVKSSLQNIGHFKQHYKNPLRVRAWLEVTDSLRLMDALTSYVL